MKRIKLTDPLHSAALKAAAAILGDPDVPASKDTYDLSGIVVTITLPAGAAITRALGSEGDGRDALGPAETVTLAAAMLAIERSGIKLSKAEWKSCSIDSITHSIKPKEHTPPEALAALAEINAELPRDCKRTKSTPAMRGGMANAEIKVEQLPKKERRPNPLEVSRA